MSTRLPRAIGVFHAGGEIPRGQVRRRRRVGWRRLPRRVRLALSWAAVIVGGAMLLGSAFVLTALHWPFS